MAEPRYELDTFVEITRPKTYPWPGVSSGHISARAKTRSGAWSYCVQESDTEDGAEEWFFEHELEEA